MLPSRLVFHCLYWHTFTMVSSSSSGVAVLVLRDSHLHIGDFTHHRGGRAMPLEVTYRDTPIQVVNTYLSAKGTPKECRPLLEVLRAQMTPDSGVVLLGGVSM